MEKNIQETGGFTLNPVEESVDSEDLAQESSEVDLVDSFWENFHVDNLAEAEGLLEQEKKKSPEKRENIESIDTMERELFRAFRKKAQEDDNEEYWTAAKRIAINSIKPSSVAGRISKLKEELGQFSQYEYEEL